MRSIQTELLRVRAFALFPALQGQLRSPTYPFRLRLPGACPLVGFNVFHNPHKPIVNRVATRSHLMDNSARLTLCGMFWHPSRQFLGTCGLCKMLTVVVIVAG